MIYKTTLYVGLIGLVLSLVVQVQAQDEILAKLKEIAIIDEKVMMPMRDGVRLATDIFRPKGNEKVPVIFSKTPYNFNAWRDGKLSKRTYQRAYEYVKQGYAYVVQNERGRYFSEGDWDILGVPTTDGYDAFEWFSKQSWCNGKVAPIGCSSTAEWQMAVVALAHPALATFVPQGFGAGVGRVGEFFEQGNWYRGGAQQMLFTTWLYGVQNDEIRPQFPKNATQEQLIRASRAFDLGSERARIDWSEGLRHLPVKDIIKNANGSKGIYEEMITRKPNDPAWYQGGLYHDNMPIERPGFWFCSWYDVSISPNLALYNHVRKSAQDPKIRDNQYLVIAPTLHCRYTRATKNTIVGERSVGDARLNYNEQIMAWFDFWLKGQESELLKNLPKVQYYTMGMNQWQKADTWPPEGAEMTTFYLSSRGKANSLFGDGKLKAQPDDADQPDAFAYDPQNPVPSYGGNVCCTGNAVKGGAYDQQEMETRNDILVYSTEPLEEGVEVSGFIETELYISSDVKDTDFTIKLIDVYPDGRAYNLDETIQRVRYREGYDKEVFMKK
ncbi:MAG: CocE/NonD family hydrolase, partial [Bacteroidota bacterium]